MAYQTDPFEPHHEKIVTAFEPKHFASTYISGFASMRGNKEFSDFKMIVDGKEFCVHRNILSIHSPVFRQMFLSRDGEQKSCEMIVGVSPKTFSILLDFIYSGQLPPSIRLSEMFDLLMAAKNFEVKHLEKHCSKVISLFARRCPAKSLFVYQAAYDIKAPNNFMKTLFKIINDQHFGGKASEECVDHPDKIPKLLQLAALKQNMDQAKIKFTQKLEKMKLLWPSH